LEQIGEGGFGVVYLAEQTEPVRRKVALKILKPGMDTRQVVARFEAERQALAIMDHPHNSRGFYRGATSTGRPNLVLEFGKRRSHYRILRPKPFDSAATLGVVHLSMSSGPTCPSKRDHPSRFEAVQYFGERSRYNSGSQDHRFRNCQGAGPRAH